jgi:hypothetical protein
MSNQKLFILKNDVKNPRWELRNKGVRIPRIVNNKSVGLREIQYVPAASSIWKEENDKEGVAQSRWFSEGALSVPAEDIVQLDFIMKHPEFNVKFELFDPEAKAEAEYLELELVEQARDLIRQISDDEDKLAATAASIFGTAALSWGAKQTKLMCYNHAATKPKEVVDTLNDASTEAKYIAALGFRKGVVDSNPQKTAVVWNDADRGVICYVATGQKPLNVLAEYLFKESEMVTLQAIGKKIEEIDAVAGIVKVKKVTKKN